MDKRVVFAVAGSGKTSMIINDLSLTERALIITYTRANIENLRLAIINKFGYFPDNIRLYPYFTFIYSFCLRPIIGLELKFEGINYKPNPIRRIAQNQIRFFIDSNNYIYSNRICKLFQFAEMQDDIVSRIEKYFDKVYVDEIQDLGAHDFNFLPTLASVSRDVLFVGDFHQHTFDTSRDGNVNVNLHSDINRYEEKFRNMGLVIDKDQLIKTHRCSPTVCNFIQDNLGINILSHRSDSVEIRYIDSEVEADMIYNDPNVVKLFYQLSKRYNCLAKNWGESKGENHYNDVCVVLNQTTDRAYLNGSLSQLPKQTINKLYVACSRSRGNLYFVPEHLIRKWRG
jgi:DNA helicase-2/ATP-dependent DNA helicase PcrA